VTATQWIEIVRKRGGWSSVDIMKIYAHAHDDGTVIDPFVA
jgi:hypothetical protein